MKLDQTQPQTCITPVELSFWLKSGRQVDLIDVRSPAEFQAAHLPGAKLVPLDELDPAALCKGRAADRPLYIVCQSGARAARAITKLAAAGIKNCVLVEGGTDAWVQAGLPLDRPGGKVLPLMRQVQITVGAVSSIGAAFSLAVDNRFAILPLIMGLGLLFAGVTGTCGLALLLARMPWNKTGNCKTGGCCNPPE